MPVETPAFDYFPLVLSIAAVIVAAALVIAATVVARRNRAARAAGQVELPPFIDTSAPSRESALFGADSDVRSAGSARATSAGSALVESAPTPHGSVTPNEQERIRARLRELDDLDHRRAISPEEYVRARAKALSGN